MPARFVCCVWRADAPRSDEASLFVGLATGWGWLQHLHGRPARLRLPPWLLRLCAGRRLEEALAEADALHAQLAGAEAQGQEVSELSWRVRQAEAAAQAAAAAVAATEQRAEAEATRLAASEADRAKLAEQVGCALRMPCRARPAARTWHAQRWARGRLCSGRCPTRCTLHAPPCRARPPPRYRALQVLLLHQLREERAAALSALAETREQVRRHTLAFRLSFHVQKGPQHGPGKA